MNRNNIKISKTSPKKIDEIFMEIALKEAQKSLNNGDFPVGSVLTIDGKLVAKSHNDMHTKNNWASHAEAKLIQKSSELIRKNAAGKRNPKIVLYATLEPCLMCLGTSVLHHITKIVYACPDPHGGATNIIDPKNLSGFYKRRWPKIIGGLMKNESYDLLTSFLKTRDDKFSKKSLALYKKIEGG